VTTNTTNTTSGTTTIPEGWVITWTSVENCTADSSKKYNVALTGICSENEAANPFDVVTNSDSCISSFSYTGPQACADVVLPFQLILEQIQKFMGIILIVVGIIMILKGRHFVYFVIGVVLGLAATGCLFSLFAMMLSNKPIWMTWASLVACAGIGIFVGILAFRKLQHLGAMALCAFACMLLFSMVATVAGLEPKISFVIDVLAVVLGLYLGYKFKTKVNIYCTSLVGAFMVTRGAGCYLPGYPAGINPGMEINNNIIYYFSAFVVLFIFGAVFQTIKSNQAGEDMDKDDAFNEMGTMEVV